MPVPTASGSASSPSGCSSPSAAKWSPGGDRCSTVRSSRCWPTSTGAASRAAARPPGGHRRVAISLGQPPARRGGHRGHDAPGGRRRGGQARRRDGLDHARAPWSASRGHGFLPARTAGPPTSSTLSAPAEGSGWRPPGSRFGYDVPLLARIPLEPSLREGGDVGKPMVESDPTNPAAVALRDMATRLVGRGRGPAGRQLGLTPTGKFYPCSESAYRRCSPIALVAVFVFGPDKLPDLARQAGRFARQLRTFANTARDELRTELGPEYADLQLRDLDPRAIRAQAHHGGDERGPTTTLPRPRAGSVPSSTGEEPPFDWDAT